MEWAIEKIIYFKFCDFVIRFFIHIIHYFVSLYFSNASISIKLKLKLFNVDEIKQYQEIKMHRFAPTKVNCVLNNNFF